ncbi:hypothetical protein YYC_05852 [Plasmodium yoelii 17X]|uniref:Fam-a protein n=1 Tax=Plasmodium yoelii 17X TaxID=1323249 RepID=V7PCS2_PLAYE|nr:hypothetical protein YYC_05852 [Plasmodium yoelii 17X]
MNKGYIKIALTLLSLAGYTQNVTFATGHPPDDTINANSAHQKPLFEESTNLICTDLDEILLAINHIMEASELLIKLSKTSIDDYSPDSTENGDKTIYSKKIGNMDIGRLHLTIPSTSNYSNLLNNLWDFNDNNKSDDKFINGNPVRVYSKYLVMLEKLNTDPNYTPLIKKYALAVNYKHSNDTIVILCPSRALNYIGQNDDETDIKKMLVSTQPIQTDVDAEEALAKLGTNIAGFVIKTGDKDKLDVTYINAIYDAGNSTEYENDKRERELAYTNILSLPQRI